MNFQKSNTQSILKEHSRRTGIYIRAFVTWIVAGLILGLFGGLVGGAFSLTVKYATAYRTEHPLIVWLLPLGGLIISLLYHASGWRPTDTNGVLLAIHQPKGVTISTGPIIFASASISHLLGASNLYFFAIACAVSYMLSANFGLYKEQMIIYSKLKLKEIDKFTD